MRKKRALWFLPLLPVAGLVIVTALASPAQSVPSFSSACGSAGCHTPDATVSISVTTASQTATTITYAVSGSNIHSAGTGWGVFSGGTKVASGNGNGQFTVAKDGTTYTVYWVDKDGATMAGYASTSVTAPMPTTTTTQATTTTTQATTTTTQATTTTTATGTTGTTAPPSTTSTTITVPPATTTTIVSNDDDDDEEDEDKGPEHGDKEKKEKEDKHDRHESAKKDTVAADSEHEDDED